MKFDDQVAWEGEADQGALREASSLRARLAEAQQEWLFRKVR
jgi:hypothetical protein